MGQRYSSNSSLRSRKSNSSIVQEFSSIVKFVHSSNIQEDLPKTSAHKAFKRFIESNRSKKKQNRRKEPDRTMASLFTLTEVDVDNIQRAWPKVEHHLLPIGIRMFISILESRCERMPVCRQKTCCNNAESKKTQCCPTQVMLNEELQKFVLLLMGIIRRSVKHISSQSAVVKLLRKCSRRHFRQLNFDLSKLDPDPLSKHFCQSVRDIITHSSVWNLEMEVSYTNLIRMIVTAMQKLATSQEYDDDSDEEEPESPKEIIPPDSPGSSGSLFPTFDRHLVLYGCQTFQDFFDMHPHIMGHFDQYQDIYVNDKLSVAEALKMHASRVLALVDDIVGNAGNPDKIRNLMHDLGRHHCQQGITEEHVDMLGPIVCHTIRPVVFKSGLWSIEVEKSWTHLFDCVAMLMKQGYPIATAGGKASSSSSSSYEEKKTTNFPTLTHIIMLKDTWAGIVEHMHELGLAAVVKLFKINYNFKFYTSPKVRYRPQTKPKDDTEHLSVVFNLIVSMVDQVILSLPTFAPRTTGTGEEEGEKTEVRTRSNQAGGSSSRTSSSSNGAEGGGGMGAIRQMEQLREPLEWIGPVFCNTVRPLLLVQGKWSYQVEMSWLLLFRHLVKKQHTTEKLKRCERYT